jgi:hypothetical protein
MGVSVNLQGVANAMELAFNASRDPGICEYSRAREVLQRIAIELFVAAGYRSPQEIVHATHGEDAWMIAN